MKKASLQKPLLPIVASTDENDNGIRTTSFTSISQTGNEKSPWEQNVRGAGKSLLRTDTSRNRLESARQSPFNWSPRNSNSNSFSAITTDKLQNGDFKYDVARTLQYSSRSDSPSGSSRSSTSSSSNFRGRKVLKDIGIGSTFWPGVKHLRKVFRHFFDVEGKSAINQTQFKQGLKHMEFDVSNTNALNALFREVDKDHNGLISEEAFLDVFRHMNRNKLEAKLARESTWIKNNPVRRTTKALKAPTPTRMQTNIIDLGKHKRRGRFRKQTVDPEDISRKLEHKPHWGDHLRWIDLKGIDATVMELVATILKLPVAILEDIEFEQRAKVEFYENHNVMQIVTHAITLENCPIRHKSDALKLQKSKVFMKKRPKLSDVQIHIFIIQEHTLVTYSKHHELNILNNIWEDLIPQLEMHTKSFQGPFLLTAKSLATEILDEVAEHNWVTRDQFKDWKINLETAIMKNTSPIHLKHILDMKQCSLVAANIFKPNAEMMDALTSEKYANTPRVRFIYSNLDDYRDVFESFTKLKDEIAFTYTTCEQLNEFYKSQQADKMNKILYLLTVVTAIISPIQLVTGIYGMNFDVMPDLDWRYSYLVFWIGSVLLVTTILFWARHRRLL